MGNADNFFSKLSKADKMFYELGYEKTEKSHLITYSRYCTKENDFENIHFFLENKGIKTNWDSYSSKFINVKEYLAINEKVKELGWINE